MSIYHTNQDYFIALERYTEAYRRHLAALHANLAKATDAGDWERAERLALEIRVLKLENEPVGSTRRMFYRGEGCF